MSDTYVDNAQNRTLGRVGMPKRKMRASSAKSGSGASKNGPAVHSSQGGKQPQSPKTYADNPQNRKLGRAGLPIGSMQVSKGSMQISKDANSGDCYSNFDGKSPAGGGPINQQARSPGTYAGNPQNRKLRVGMTKGSMTESKYSNNGSTDSSARFKDQGYERPVRAADSIRSGKHDRSLTFKGNSDQSLHFSSLLGSGTRSRTHAEHQQNKGSRKVDVPHIEDDVWDNPGAAKQTRVYKDNPLNRRLERVGLPIGMAVFSSKAKTVLQLFYEDTDINRKLNRVGKPRGCLPLQKKSSTTKKIPEMLARLKNDDEFERLVFEDRTCNDDLEIHLLDSRGDRDEAFDQAMYRYNRWQAEQSWKSSNAAKKAPKTQVNLLNDNEYKQIPFGQLKLHKVIGKGGFGVVFFAKWQDTVVAVKKLQSEKISNARIKDFKAEIEKFCKLDHRNIVKFIGACVEKSNPCIVMEYMQMTLYDAVHVSEIDFTENEQIDIIRQVCEGMKYLHKERIAHCDLKTPNILLDYVKGKICEVKITDFGLSMIIHDTSVSVEEMVKNIGTPQYSPPEMLRGEILSAKDMMKADVYSLALIFLEVIFREEPFPDYSYLQLKKEVGIKGAQPEIPNVPEIDQSIKNIMQQAWSNEPTERPTVVRICELLQRKHIIYKNN